MKHTPGPWTQEKRLIPGQFGYERTIRATDRAAIADINIGPLADEANARLIAAAPEMMVLLERFEEEDTQWDSEFVSDFANEVYALLKKIRGEE